MGLRAGVASACLALANLAGAAAPGRSDVPIALDVVEAAPGVFVHVGRHEDASASNLGDIANIGFVIGETCVAVIDSGGSQAVGSALSAAVRGKTDRPVCYVVNTHMHPDHVFGNGAFAEAAEKPRFVGSANLPQALAARAAGYRAALVEALGEAGAAGSRIVPPDVLVDGSLRLDLGGRTLLLQGWPTAHTNNDVTVLDEATGTLWLGDLLFEGRIPSVDGSIKGWLEVSARLRELPVKRVIPGHGRVSPPWPAALDAQAGYLGRIVARVREAIAQGMTLRETVDAADPAEAQGWVLAEGYHRRNVTAAYAELEWE